MSQRITVGYVELTEEESERLFKQVEKDKEVMDYDGLQGLMNDFDSRVIEPVNQPLGGIVDEAPREEIGKGDRYIEVFNKLEEDSRYRIRSSDQSKKEVPE